MRRERETVKASVCRKLEKKEENKLVGSVETKRTGLPDHKLLSTS